MKNTFASRAFATNFGKGKNVSSDEIESATSAFLESGGEITKLPSIGYDVEEDISPGDASSPNANEGVEPNDKPIKKK